MDAQLVKHISSLIPVDYPDGLELLEEGKQIGASLNVPRNKFLKRFGYESYLDYRKENTRNGKMTWQLLLGLSSLDEQLDAIKALEEFSDRTGLDIRTVQNIPSMLTGLPQSYWDKAPKPTSYVLPEDADWRRHSDAAAIQIIWQDWHLATPHNLQTTINAIEAGTPRLGTFSQMIWDFPNFTDDRQRFSDMVRSLGIVASQRDRFITVDTYPEDGVPGYFMDVASYVGYVMMERHIVNDLCGARLSVSYGGLLTDIQPRMAFGMALHKMFGSWEEPILSYYNGGTLEQWAHDIEANYGTGVQEMLIQTLVELKYQMHTAISPVSVTEALRVPTLQELLDIAAAGRRAETKAKEWLPLMDFSPLEAIRDELIEKGTEFYNNMFNTFEAAGVNMNDPLELIMVLKRLSPMQIEQAFHPSTQGGGEFSAYVPSVLGRQTLQMADEIIQDIKSEVLDHSLSGKKIVVVSADGHSYGLMLVDRVMHHTGARIINGGVDMDPIDLLDLADEEETNIVMISAHIGQVLDYGRQLLELQRKRGKTYHIFVGGMMNAMLPGNTVPVDVTDQLIELGIHPSNDLLKSIRLMQDL